MRVLAVLGILSLLIPQFALAEVRDITFPVAGTFSFRNDYGDPRGDGTRTHVGNDIIADKMTPVVATVDGVITFIAIPQVSWGYSLTLRDSQGYAYRYIHLNNDTPGTDDGAGGEAHAYAPGIDRGVRVVRGQLLGWLGDSGNAENTVSHLHFEIETPTGANINPYDSLFAAAGGNGSGIYIAPVIIGTEGSVAAEEAFVVVRQLQEGMVDRDIVGLHNELTTLGFYTGEITENFTSETREAVRRFQVAKGLFPNGIATVVTRKKLVSALKTFGTVIPAPTTPAKYVFTKTLSLGMSGEEVRQLQLILISAGYLKSSATGYFGTLTETALKTFQTANGLEPVGILGLKTREILNT